VARAFYAPAAQASFTLLGLWWVVAQFKYAEWSATPAGRRLMYDVSLFFLLPGTMSLASLVSDDEPGVWRIAFGLLALAGAGEALASAIRSRADAGRRPLLEAGLTAGVVLYGLIGLVALAPGTAADASGLSSLELEGLMVAALLFLGVNMAWAVFQSRRA
jgi:hypothetical protein